MADLIRQNRMDTKDHVRRENVTARERWPRNYGFLIEEYWKLNNLGVPVSSSRASNTGEFGGGTMGVNPVIPKRRKDFPQTTSQEIGWKSTQDGRNADMVTRYEENKFGKCTINTRLNWPSNVAP